MSEASTGEARVSPLRPLSLTSAVALGVLVVTGWTARDYGLTTDEPRYIENTDRMTRWLVSVPRDGPAVAFTSESLGNGWYYARQDSKNLPLVSLISAFGHAILGRFDSPPTSHRWGNLIVLAVTCAVMFYWVSQEYSTCSAIVAIVALLGMPRVFAHAQLLSIDPLVGSFQVLAAWALWNSLRREGWKWPIFCGLLVGLGAASKPTFWLIVPVWVLWGLVVDRRRLWRAGLCMLLLSPLTVLLLFPLWWPNPFGGIASYLDLLLNDPIGWKIDAYYLGEIFQAEFAAGLEPVPVPWHSVPLLIAVTTPPWILGLGIVAIIGWARERFSENDAPDTGTAPLEGLWLISGLLLPLVIMLPMTPAHDGTRLYRPAFYFGALLAAAGFERLRRRFLCARPAATSWQTPVVVVALVLLAGWTTLSAHPAGLSYYNVTVGGFPGATTPVALGTSLPEPRRPLFEISYWWELLGKDALSEMQQHLPHGSRVTVFPEHFGLPFLQDWGQLRDDLEFVPLDQADYILMYGRLGRLADPRTHPWATRFLHEKTVEWEHRVHGVRIAALLRVHRR